MRNKHTARLRAEWIPRAQGAVLEVGIGSGLNLAFYSSDVLRIYGVDPSAELRRMARKRADSHLAKVEFLSQSAEEPMPIPEQTIDTVVVTWKSTGVVMDIPASPTNKMTAPRMTADKIIKELGIAEPADIDIEAIAQYCCATIIYESLTGCEARLVGNADRAIITVNSASRRGRQRFSAGHELGHWMRDRNKVGFSCTNALFRSQWGIANPERGANEFAADLLLPPTIFARYAYSSPVTLEAVRALAIKFDTSLAATAIRLVQHGSFPAMVVYLSQGVRKWFVAGPDVPSVLSPRETPTSETLAGELLRGGDISLGPQPVQADGWLTHARSKWYELMEDSVRFRDGSILALLWWKNEKQILDLMDED